MAISPVLGLAMIVEIRLVQWHRFRRLWRYAIGFLSGAVLTGLGLAVTIALSVLRGWDAAKPVYDWQFEVTFWAVYVGVISVLSLPVTQLWLVVFVDFSPLALLLLLQMEHQKRVHLRLLKQIERVIQTHKGLRRELQIDIAEQILRHPAGVFSSGKGKFTIEVTDPFVIKGRQMLTKMADEAVEMEKVAKKRRKAFRRREREQLKTSGTHPKRAAQALRRYQNLGR